jgi:hypothetical protein
MRGRELTQFIPPTCQPKLGDVRAKLEDVRGKQLNPPVADLKLEDVGAVRW